METTIAGPIYAGFWRRAAAYLVDSIVLLIPNVVLAMALQRREPASSLAQFAVWWLYKSLMESGSRQATLGKMALGIKVTDVHGARISFGRATGRFFASLLSMLIFCIGLLMAAFTRRKQALHDLIAGTLVVRGTAEPTEIVEGSGTMALTAGVWAAIVFFTFIPLAGILAAIAIPVYQDAVVRAKMVEAIHEGAQLKPDAAREIEAYKADPAAGGASSHAVTPKSQYITRIVIDKPARAIDVVLDGRKIGALQEAAPRIRWIVAEDGATWSCEAAGVPDKYLPADCRH
jgi:uncharacterized RDD family membrane protein YckC/Tfp pilus assembly major pilin PilA